MLLGVLPMTIAGAAWTQDAELGWTSIGTAADSAAAWTMKPAADSALKPQVIIVMRSATPGTAPGTDIRTSVMFRMEADCAAGKLRPKEQAAFGEDFIQISLTPVQNTWGNLAEFGELGGVVNHACVTPNRTIEWQADIKGAQQKLDAKIPKPKIPITPPASATFEYVGKSSVSYQPIQSWLDTASITREGNLAKAWSPNVWENGWSGVMNFSPITWRLHEFECVERPRERTLWSQDVGSDLKPGDVLTAPDAKFEVAGDTNVKAMALRVCNNRPLLFSETIKGDLKTFISKRFIGASEKLASGVALERKPAPQLVDLGPTIRISEKDQYWSYSGTFTCQGGEGSSTYTGVFQAEGINNPNRATLYVRGIQDGKLIIDRQGTPEGEFAIPAANGKSSGKGIASWNRADGAYSWTLVEPTTIKLK